MIERWQQWARSLKTELYAIYLACRDPRVPWQARIVAVCVVGYAFSPIDLIPDPIPILGYLDDLILLPLGIALVLRLIPPAIMAECRAQARATLNAERPTSWRAALVIVMIWLLLAAAAGFLLLPVFQP